MKLTSIRIQNYKVIDDTKAVPIDERVTAFVGKNVHDSGVQTPGMASAIFALVHRVFGCET